MQAAAELQESKRPMGVCMPYRLRSIIPEKDHVTEIKVSHEKTSLSLQGILNASKSYLITSSASSLHAAVQCFSTYLGTHSLI